MSDNIQYVILIILFLRLCYVEHKMNNLYQIIIYTLLGDDDDAKETDER